jgi:hypothetical protein
MDTVERIAEASLVVDNYYPFEHWLFVWRGEALTAHINRDTKDILTFFDDLFPPDEIYKIRSFIRRKLEERQLLEEESEEEYNDKEDPEGWD